MITDILTLFFSYQICQYCYDDFMDKNYQQTKGSSAVSKISMSDDSEGSNPENEASEGDSAKDDN